MKKDLDLTIFDATISSILRCKSVLPSVNLTSIQRYNWFWLSKENGKHKTTHVQLVLFKRTDKVICKPIYTKTKAKFIDADIVLHNSFLLKKYDVLGVYSVVLKTC